MINRKLAYVIRHVAFEDLGSFKETIQNHGYAIQYFEAGFDDLSIILNSQPDLLIVLGGPIGVYDHDDYPFLRIEVSILKDRIEKDLATLGICLGAQLIAYALGSEVYNGGTKEIGWDKLQLKNQNNYFSHLSNHKTSVLHWHGDTFKLPTGAQLQASTEIYLNQAFTYGNNILALQFHLEVTELGMEKWFIGHANEIASTNGISVLGLRSDTKQNASTLTKQAKMFLEGWLNSLVDT